MKAAHRGVKRKRYDPPREKDIGERIAGKLHHELREVKKATKKSKTFETQKLVKKLKSLRLKDGAQTEINEFETQLEELKTISHDAVATTALRSRLTKDRLLADNEHIQTALAKELETNLLISAPPGTPAAKVQSRLLSSKLVAASISHVVSDLKAVINPPEDAGDEEDAEPLRRPTKVTKLSSDSTLGDVDVEMQNAGSDTDEISTTRDMDIDQDASYESESGTVGDDEKEQYDDDGWESGSLSDTPVGAGREAENSSEDEAGAAGPSLSSKNAASSSTFLPSLAVGFTRGDSGDSDWSDGEDRETTVEPRKNRRGQRARQAIWEKKYGRGANHKKKEAAAIKLKEEERGRKRWPDNKKGAGARPQGRNWQASASTNHRPSQGPSDRRTAGSGEFTRLRQHPDVGRNRGEQAPHPPNQEASLHPSWEAKRKLKEKQSAAIIPSTASKKIVF